MSGLPAVVRQLLRKVAVAAALIDGFYRDVNQIAADLRDSGDGRQAGLLKIVAGMLGVGLDDLVQREVLRRQRRMTLITAASVAGMLVASGLAYTAIQARDEARAEADREVARGALQRLFSYCASAAS